jgi:hypothetical protein
VHFRITSQVNFDVGLAGAYTGPQAVSFGQIVHANHRAGMLWTQHGGARSPESAEKSAACTYLSCSR